MELREDQPFARRGGQRADSESWLRERLAGGAAAERAVLIREAAERGWSESMLRRAASDAGVESQPMPGRDKNRVLWSLRCADELTD